MIPLHHPQWRYYLRHAGLPLLLAVLVFGVFEFTDLDLRINDLFYDPVAHVFPLRNNVLIELIAHRWAKYPVIALAIGLAAGWIASFFKAAWKPHRRQLLFVILAMMLGSEAVGLLKQTTHRHCPYDLAVYGGYAPYRKLLEPAAEDVRPGQCWPGGHATSGFSLMAFYFLWRRSRPQLATGALAGGVFYGLLLGGSRMIQGAHFLSHNLWSGLICWFVMLLLYELLLRREDPGQHTLDGHRQHGTMAAPVARV